MDDRYRKLDQLVSSNTASPGELAEFYALEQRLGKEIPNWKLNPVSWVFFWAWKTNDLVEGISNGKKRKFHVMARGSRRWGDGEDIEIQLEDVTIPMIDLKLRGIVFWSTVFGQELFLCGLLPRKHIEFFLFPEEFTSARLVKRGL